MNATAKPCFVQLPVQELERLGESGFKNALTGGIAVVAAAVVTGVFSLLQNSKKTDTPVTASARVTVNISGAKASDAPPVKFSERNVSSLSSVPIGASSKSVIPTPEISAPVAASSKPLGQRPVVYRQGSVTFYRPFGKSLKLHEYPDSTSKRLTVMDEGQLVDLDESIDNWLYENKEGKPCVWVWVSTTDANNRTWRGWCAASVLKCEEENGPIERRLAEIRNAERQQAQRRAVERQKIAPVRRPQIHETEEGGACYETWSTPERSGGSGSYWYRHSRSVSY